MVRRTWLIMVLTWAIGGWSAAVFEQRHGVKVERELTNQVEILTSKQAVSDTALDTCQSQFNDFVEASARSEQEELRNLFRWGAIGVQCDEDSCWIEEPILNQGTGREPQGT